MTTVVAVEYLYENALVEDRNGHLGYEVRQHQIIKRTAKRVFFDAGWGRTKSVDRQVLERDGHVWVRDFGGYRLYANLADAQPAPRETPAEKVSRLRADMAAVHPDRGGDAAEFRAAYDRYRRAVAAVKVVTESTEAFKKAYADMTGCGGTNCEDAYYADEY